MNSRIFGVGVMGVAMGRTGERDVSTADVSVWPQHEGNGGDQLAKQRGIEVAFTKGQHEPG